jgi:hypothetical protein
MGIEFRVAAKSARATADQDVVEVTFPNPIGVVKAVRPTSAQAELIGESLRISPTRGALEFVGVTMGAKVESYLRGLLLDGTLDREDIIGGWGENDEGKNVDGLIDQIMEEFTGRPTEPSTDSSSSRATGGRSSTRRSPGKGSTRSTSPSSAS